MRRLFQPGQKVQYRSVYRGRVRWLFPRRVIADDGQSLVLNIAPRATGVWLGRDSHGRYVDRWVAGDPPIPLVWHSTQVLSVTPPSAAHSLWLMWSEAWEFQCRHVQSSAKVPSFSFVGPGRTRSRLACLASTTSRKIRPSPSARRSPTGCGLWTERRTIDLTVAGLLATAISCVVASPLFQ